MSIEYYDPDPSEWARRGDVRYSESPLTLDFSDTETFNPGRDEWTKVGSGPYPTVSGGSATVPSDLELVLLRTHERCTDLEAVMEITTTGGLGGAGSWSIVARSSIDGQNLLMARWNSASSGVLEIHRRISGSFALRATTASGAAPAVSDTTYWLKARFVGDTITVEWWATDPAAGGSPVTSLFHTLSAPDAAVLGAGVSGSYGFRHSTTQRHALDHAVFRPEPGDTPDEQYYDVLDYGTLDSAANSAAAIDAALTAAAANSSGAAVVRLPALAFSTTGGHTVPAGCRVLGYGVGSTIITHTGNNACFTYTPNDYDNTGAVCGFTIVGNSGASAVGVRYGDCWGFQAKDLRITGYTSGRGMQLYNDAGWTEGSHVQDVRIQNCAVGIQMTRTASSSYDSFGYNHFNHVHINVPASGAGIVLGDSALAAGHYVYHCVFDMQFWLGSGAYAIGFDGDTQGQHNVMTCFGENESGATSTATWGGANPSYFEYRGYVRVASDDQSEKSNQSLNFQETEHDAPIVIYRGCSGQNDPVIVVKDNANNTNITMYDWGGVVGKYLAFGAGSDPDDPTYIQSGSGSPEGAVNGRVGFLYIDTSGGAGSTLYVKESGTGNTGWAAK